MSQECPHCGLLSPDAIGRCDCGFDFTTRSIASPSRAAVAVKFTAAAFFLHVGAATAAALAGGIIGFVLGLGGQIALFGPVILAASLMGWFTANRLNPGAATWVWLPAAVWFAGWAGSSVSQGLNHFNRVFIGADYCGDFSCAGQLLVTSPLVGGISYVIMVRAIVRASGSMSDRRA